MVALTGRAFDFITQNRELKKMIYDDILLRCKVYARTSPLQKAHIVKCLQKKQQKLKEPMMIAMCGDGANDCAALKAADVGVSLSNSEASVAAPFTSRVSDITCIPAIISEGKACLWMTV